MEKITVRSVSLASSPERTLARIASLDDHVLLDRITRLVERERSTTAYLVAHLAEMDRRRLHLDLGYSSLFTYCTQALHLSEQAAYKRIEAARAGRRFPVLLARLAEGALHLSAIGVLVPVLTRKNHATLIEEARYKTKLQVEEIVARVRPAPAVATVVQKLPAPKAPVQEEVHGAPPLSPPCAPSTPQPLVPETIPPRPVVAPLAPERYRVQFTAGGEMHERLMRAQALLRHKVPNGDIAQILDLALIALLEKTEARKYGKRRTTRRAGQRCGKRKKQREAKIPQSTVRRSPELNEKIDAATPKTRREPPRSRHIPATVRRAVWERDGGRCTFESADGVRCSETSFLEFDHREPYACGGLATIENIRLVCRRHNQHFARVRFGDNEGQVRDESPSYAGFHAPSSLVKQCTTIPGDS